MQSRIYVYLHLGSIVYLYYNPPHEINYLCIGYIMYDRNNVLLIYAQTRLQLHPANVR